MTNLANDMSSMDHVEIWENCLELIKESVNSRSFETWFLPIKSHSLEDSNIILNVPNKFFSEWLDNHYKNVISNALYKICGKKIKIHYVVRENKPYSAYHYEPETKIKSSEIAKPQISVDANLNNSYTFDRFVVGDGNRFAQAACYAVSESPGNTNYNPLIIYGGTGLGKTHLLQAIGIHALEKHPGLKVHYTSSENFTQYFISSIQKNKVIEFSNFYRSCDLLLIDDIHFFSNKGKTQEEFFHTFNSLHQNKKQIVLTSDRPINELSFLEERLISRFKWGLITDIQPPDLETRIAILQKKCEDNSLDISQDIIEYLAVNLTHNVRELEGALTRIMAHVLLSNVDPSLELAKKVVQEIGRPIDRNLNAEQIIEAVSKAFNVPTESIMKKGRKKEVAFARQVAMYLAKEMTQYSVTTIGLHFGGRDHSTVIYAHKTISHMLQKDTVLQQKLTNLKRILEFSR